MREIKICRCGAPLHYTFLYHGAEYYCMNCKGSEGMLGAGQNVPVTPELIAQAKVAGDVFKALRKHLIGSGGYTRSNCKKCSTRKDRYHTDHLTPTEVERDRAAQKILDGLEGKII